MEPTMELKQAVKKYREGDKEAFTRLYEESGKYVYTCIYKVMGGNDNVQDTVCDIMQDTYVEISKNIAQLDNEDSFLSWAGTIATRKCYAWLKKNKKYVLLQEEDDTFTNLADDDNIIPEGIMQDREKQRLIRQIIDTQLTQMQKLCIVAYYYNEQKQSEIAKELGIPENTVKTNLSRAKAKIKDGVLDLEKRQGTKLYSVAPILLLLFGEEVSACTVPASVTAAVNGSVLAAGKAGMKSLLARAAEASAKAKITAGVIGAGAAIAAGGIIYTAMQNQGEPWEEEFRKRLLGSKNAAGFDLNDFEEDGIPELLVLYEDGTIKVYYCHEYGDTPVFELYSNQTIELGAGESFYPEYGYDMDYSRMVELIDWTFSSGQTVPNYNYHHFSNGEWETVEQVKCGYSTRHDIMELHYSLEEDGQSTPISEEEAMEYIADARSRFNEIRFTDISEEDIEERFAEFKENGNRRRRRNRGEEAADQPEKEMNETAWPWERQEPQETPADETEITLSDREQESLSVMLSVITIDSYNYSEDMFGNSYPVDNLEEDMRLVDILSFFAHEDDSYRRYLPAMELDSEPYTFKRYFEIEDMKSYLKNVFGIEDAELSAYCEGDRVIRSMVASGIPYSRNVVDHAVQTAEGTYKISGTFYLVDGADDVETEFPYTLIVAKNDDSPFGFQLISLEYSDRAQGNDGQQASGDGSLDDILLDREGNSAFYPQGVEYGNIYFARLDIDGDGEEEIMLGTTNSFDYYGKPIWIVIFNILKYDGNTGEVWDFDGDNIYEPLNSSANPWQFYDTGILTTMADASYGYTKFWNFLTGEYTEGWLWYPDDPDKGIDSEGHSKVSRADGTEITGEEGERYYQSLKSGNEIPIVWCEANRENVDALMTGGRPNPVHIPTPYGGYKANRGMELYFYEDGTVLVSEGNSSTKCAFTIDEEGKIVIDPDGEAIEGTYDAQADEIRIYALKFRR